MILLTTSTINPTNSGKKRAKKVYELDGLCFKSKEALNYYSKLKSLQEEGFIRSFNTDSLIVSSKETKFKAKSIFINEHKFDSMLEADYYLHLLSELQSNRIQSFELKPSFLLQPSFTKNDKRFAQIKYIADFKVITLQGDTLIVDTKGVITPDFKIKQKMFEYIHPHLSLQVVKYVKSYGGWIEYDEWLKQKKQKGKKKKK